MAAAVPSSQHRASPKPPLTPNAAAAAAVTAYGAAAADYAAMPLPALDGRYRGSGSPWRGSPGKDCGSVQSPFADAPDHAAKRLDAEFGEAADAKLAATLQASSLEDGERGGVISSSIRGMLHPTRVLSRALSGRIGSFS